MRDGQPYAVKAENALSSRGARVDELAPGGRRDHVESIGLAHRAALGSSDKERHLARRRWRIGLGHESTPARWRALPPYPSESARRQQEIPHTELPHDSPSRPNARATAPSGCTRNVAVLVPRDPSVVSWTARPEAIAKYADGTVKCTVHGHRALPTLPKLGSQVPGRTPCERSPPACPVHERGAPSCQRIATRPGP